MIKLSSQVEGSYLEVIYELKLVGLVILSDMTWNAHVKYTVKRVNGVLWQLARFKRLGANRDKLLTFYVLKITSILMFGAICFYSALTLEQRSTLELQQKRSLAIILGTEYRNYSHARSQTNIPELEILQEEACLKWANKAQANPQHRHLFPLNELTANTMYKKVFREYNRKGATYFNSAIPYMLRILNRNKKEP